MPVTNFDDPKKKLRPDASAYLEVSGPFKLSFPRSDVIGPVTLRFLLIQEVQGTQPATVDHQVEFHMPDAQEGVWTTEVDVPNDLPTGKYRAVGQGILIRKPVNPDDPPLFLTLTWCVTREIKDQTAST